MASSSQIRSWWSTYECATSKMVRVAFPGPNGPTQWSLLVADKSAPIWVAVAQIMVSEPYLFRETAGGTYNCRPPSLHAYGLAIDLNPSKNPYDCPMVTDMPDTFIARMEGVRANGKQAIQWGGRWPCENPPDPMHFQINVAPGDCKDVVWDTGDNDGGDDDMPLTKEDYAEISRFVWQNNSLMKDAITGEAKGAQHLLQEAEKYAHQAATTGGGGSGGLTAAQIDQIAEAVADKLAKRLEA